MIPTNVRSFAVIAYTSNQIFNQSLKEHVSGLMICRPARTKLRFFKGLFTGRGFNPFVQRVTNQGLHMMDAPVQALFCNIFTRGLGTFLGLGLRV